jgi:nucleoside-diphosphate kinase
MEKTLVLIKPDAVQRGLIGEIVSRFEKKGLKLVGMKMIQLNDEILADHYSHIATKPFFKGIAEFMKSTPIIACCWEGLDCVNTVRNLTGVTKAREAAVGTIRGDMAMSIQANVAHTSDSLEAAEIEVNRFFKPEEIFSYEMALAPFIYSADERK